jgi:hypothetical protein
MNDYVEVIAIVEGKTEQVFVESILVPYLSERNVFMAATQVSKSGQKGGDVKFSRTEKDLRNHLKQRLDTYVTTIVDYYGIKEWPGIDQVPNGATPAKIAEVVNEATRSAVIEAYPEVRADTRFIPYVAVHEFEALLFSDSEVLATKVGVDKETVDGVIAHCGEPEAINNNPTTAPGRRLDAWSPGGKFKKTTTGIAIAREIGIATMRDQCPIFNAWLTSLEQLVRTEGDE